MKRPNHQKKPWSPWLKAFFALILVGVLSFGGLFAAVMYGSYNHITGDPQVMVILGCRVMPGEEPSMLLQDRLETALDYLEEDPDILVVVSGGQGSNEPVSEAACMAGWLEERGIPSTDLMERAAAAIAEQVMALTEEGPGRVVCFCGPGNNGGDGVACARLLLEAGFEVKCVLVGAHEKMTPDTRAMEARLVAAGGKLEPFRSDDPAFAAWCLGCGAMVDALFGIGLNSPIRGDALIAVQMMNTCAIPVVSADIPSGVEADTGRVLGAAVEAAATVTFTLPKLKEADHETA